MNRKTKEFLAVLIITSIVVIATGIVMAFFMSGIPVLQIIATVVIIAVLVYGMIWYNHDCEDDDFRG